MASQKHTKNRMARLKRALNRHGTPNKGTGRGWAAKQAARRVKRRGNKRGARRSIGYRL